MSATQPFTPPATRIETADAAEHLCSSLLETAAELVAVLDRETGLLRGGKPQEIVALHARKSALSAELSRSMASLKQDAEFIKMAVPHAIEALRDQQAVLQRSLDANHDALAAMKSVSESLLRVVAAKASERRSGPETYGGNAALSPAQAPRPSAISVDKRL